MERQHIEELMIFSIKKWTITVSIVLIVIGFITMGSTEQFGNRALNFSL